MSAFTDLTYISAEAGQHGRQTAMKTLIRQLNLLLLLLLTGYPGYADESTAARAVIDALLDWDIPLASERWREWRTDEPANPSLPLYRAVIEVAEADYSPEMNTDKYDPPISTLNKIISADRSYLLSYPDDFYHRLTLATAQAIAGRLLMEQGHWLSAYQYGRESRAGMSRIMAARPGFEDGYLILGLFEYFTGEAPAILRWLGRLVDFSGDRSKGIRYLERCVNHCDVANAQAADALLLEVTYLPGESCRYLPLARQMMARYPGNPRYPAATERLLQECLAAPPSSRQAPGGFSLATPRR